MQRLCGARSGESMGHNHSCAQRFLVVKEVLQSTLDIFQGYVLYVNDAQFPTAVSAVHLHEPVNPAESCDHSPRHHAVCAVWATQHLSAMS